jgi:hypothetical protein
MSESGVCSSFRLTKLMFDVPRDGAIIFGDLIGKLRI